MVYLLSSSAMPPSLSYLSLSLLSPSAMGSLLPSPSPNVFALLCSQSYPSSITPMCFWLVVAFKISNSGHLRPLLYFIYVIFLSFNLLPQNKKNIPHMHSIPAVHPLHHPSYCCCQLLVDCCVLQPNSGNLRLRTHPPLYFLMHLNLASQPREPTVVRANPPPGACNRLVGSRGTMIWGHGRCCHGNIGQSRWG
jgi:hypothetical protein